MTRKVIGYKQFVNGIWFRNISTDDRKLVQEDRYAKYRYDPIFEGEDIEFEEVDRTQAITVRNVPVELVRRIDQQLVKQNGEEWNMDSRGAWVQQAIKDKLSRQGG